MKGSGRARESGQAYTEYALMLIFIALFVSSVLAVTGLDVSLTMCRVVVALNSTQQCGHYFQDDFANLSGWNIISGAWQAANGFLTGGPNEGRIFHNLSQSDYTINLKDVTLNQGNGYGVFFRASNTSAVNGYSFQYDPGYGSGGSFIMRKWVNGNELAPFAAVPAPAGFNWNQPNRQIQVVVKGNTFTAYVDGKKMVSGSDSTYPSGGIGLRTWDGTTFRTDNLTVDPAP